MRTLLLGVLLMGLLVIPSDAFGQTHLKTINYNPKVVYINWIAFSPDNMMFAALVMFTNDKKPTVLLYDVETKQEVCRLQVGTSSRGCCFSPDGTLLVVSANGPSSETSRSYKVTTFYCWDMKTRKVVKTVEVPFTNVWVSHISHDNKTIYAACYGNIIVYDLTKEKYTTYPCLKRFHDLTVSPDGKLLALSSSRECKVAVYEVATGKCLRTFDYPDRRFKGALSASFSPDNKTLAIVYNQIAALLYNEVSEITLYRLSDGKAIRRIPLPETYSEGIHFLKDGNTIVVRGVKKAKDFSTPLPGFYLVRIDTGEIVAPLGQGKSYSPLKSAVSPDGKLLLLANEDLRLWSLKEKK